MVFKVQLIKGNKPVTNKTVKMHESGLGGTHTMRHTGNGWYECDSDASRGKIFVSNELWGSTEHGIHPNSDTIYIRN